MNDLISIIVPIYNSEKFLKECIESIINQSFKNIEIILVNDGSTDNSLKICEYYANIDKRIKIINKKNEGVSVARNVGIKNANGKYIGFVDSDDFINLTMYENLYNIMNKYNVDFVMCKYFRVDENLNIKEVNEPFKYGYLEKNCIIDTILAPMIGSKLNDMSSPKIIGSNWRCLYKKDIIIKNKLMFKNKKIAEDMLFNLSYIGRIESAFVIDKPLYYYRYNSNSATSNYIYNLWNEITNQIELVEYELKAMDIENCKIKERLISSKLYFICWCISNEMHKNNPNEYKKITENIKLYTKSEFSKDAFTFKNINKMQFKERCAYLCIKLQLYKLYYWYFKNK